MEKINLSWLRRARRNKHMTMGQAAKAIGKDRSTFWRYENGVVPMSVDTLFDLLAIYGVSILDVTQKVEETHEDF